MIIKNYQFNGFLIEIHQHPLYENYFEYVVKTSDAKHVKGTSTSPYKSELEAERAAQENIRYF